MDLSTGDDSKVLLVEIQGENNEPVNSDKANIDKVKNKDADECLTPDANAVQRCSGAHSNVLLVESPNEDMELVHCGEANIDSSTNKAVGDLASSPMANNESLAQGNYGYGGEPGREERVRNQYDDPSGLRAVVPQSSVYDGNDSRDDDFSAKDLLCFAWQIARGMVRTYEHVEGGCVGFNFCWQQWVGNN